MRSHLCKTPCLGVLFFVVIFGLVSVAFLPDPSLAENPDYGAYLHIEGLKNIDPDWDPQGIAWSDDYLYVAGGFGGLFVFHRLPPWEPQFLGHRSLYDTAWDITIVESYAFIADGNGGVVVVNVAVPSSPDLISQLPLTEDARAIDICQEYLLVGTEERSVVVIDHQNLSDLQIETRIEVEGSVRDIAITENELHAFAVVDGYGIAIIDLHLQPPDQIAGVPGYPDARCIVLDGELAYLGTGSGMSGTIEVFDIHDPSSPLHLTSVPTDHSISCMARDQDGLVAGFDDDPVLGTFSLTNPQSPTLLGEIVTVGVPRDLALQPGQPYAYLAGSYDPVFDGVEVINLGDRTTPVPAHVEPFAGPMSVVEEDGILYVADRYDGLLILDADDFSLLGQCPLADDGVPMFLVKEGDFVYAMHFARGLQIADVSDPYNPRRRGFLWLAWPDCWGHDVRDGIACVAAGDDGVAIVDVGDSNSPMLLTYAEIDTPYVCTDVVMADNYAFATMTGGWGLFQMVVFDIADPNNPQTVAALRLPNEGFLPDPYFTSIDAHPDQAVVISGTAGLYVCDLSDLDHLPMPTYVRSPAIFDLTSGGFVTVDGSTAYVVGIYTGVNVFDISNLDLPRHAGSIPIPGYPSPYQLAVGGETIFVPDATGSLLVFPRHQPDPTDAPDLSNPSTAIHLSPCRPNPFEAGTMLRYELPVASPIRLAIYDSTGRLVRLLSNGIREPGTHVVTWDGRNGLGQPVAGGVYFATVKAAKEKETQRLIVVR